MEFDRQTKRQAIKAFSRVHGASAAYLIIAIALIYIAQFATMFIVGSEGLIALSENPYYIWGLQVGGMYLVAFPLFLLMVRKLPSAQRERGDMSLKEFGYIFLVSEAIMLIGAIFSNWLNSVISGIIGHEIPNTTADIISATPIWLIILVVVVIGPIVEEMIFRKIFIDKLSVYGDRLAIVVSSIAFGFFHGNLYQLFYATALGLVLGYVYTKTRRSIYNCLLHMAINFMGSILPMLAQDSLNRLTELPVDAVIEGALLTDYYIVMGTTVLQYGLAIAGIVVFIIATVKRSYEIPNECDIEIPFVNRPRVVFFNIGTICFFIFCILQCIANMFLV